MSASLRRPFSSIPGASGTSDARMGVHITLLQVSLAVALLCTADALDDKRAQRVSSFAPGSAPGSATPVPPAPSAAPPSLYPLGVPLLAKTSWCGAGRYWNAGANSGLGRCADCTHCAGTGREVTIRPCDGLRDAQCGSVKDLKIDWEWLRTSRTNGVPSVHERANSLTEAEARLLRPQRPSKPQQLQQHERLIDFGDDYILPDHPRQPQHQKEKKKMKKRNPLRFKGKPFGGDDDDFTDFGASGDAAVDSDDEDIAFASRRRAQRQRTTTQPSRPSTSTTQRPTTTPSSLVEDFRLEDGVERDRLDEEMIAELLEAGLGQRTRPGDDVVATTKTFTTAETLVWDWQAGVLVAAVCACLLFFIVAAAYSCQHAWHFKKLKKNLDADMVEISARLALMSGIGSEHLHDAGSTSMASSASPEKGAFQVTRGDHLRTARQQNEYCLSTLPRKTRV